MRLPLPNGPSLPPRLLLAALLTCAGACANTFAGPFEQARQRDRLVAGVAYVPQAYSAGAKFRTPEGIETALAEDLGKRLRLPAATVAAVPALRPAMLAGGKVELLIDAIADTDPLRRSAILVPTGFSAGPMAIMRSDTDIKRWEQLKGRTVCLAEGGRYAGAIAARYGAIEKRFRAPADALLALRTGGCDAAVHDNTLLEELIKLPEWKKFSARLPVGPRHALLFAVPASERASAAFLKQTADDWRASGYLSQLVRKMARNIAFEVYLDQDVPDCH